MRLEPGKRRPSPRVGIVRPDGLVVLDGGELRSLADTPADARLFVRPLDAPAILWRVGGQATWNKRRVVRWRIEGHDLLPLRDTLVGLDDGQVVDGLVVARDWLAGYGVPLGSLAGTSLALWRATLPRPFRAYLNRFPVPSGELTIGGRQECERGWYPDVSMWDIRGAYQHATQRALVPILARPVDRPRLDELDGHVGFVRAVVKLPPDRLAFGPLPIREPNGKRERVVYPREGRFQGMWSVDELTLARSLGAHVIPTEAWVGRGVQVPFGQWSRIIREGRELPGAAGSLAKGIGNALWGFFAASGAPVVTTYAAGRGIVEKHRGTARKPICLPIAAQVAAAIRVRLYWDALRPDTVAAHTDGAMLTSSTPPAGGAGDKLGDWRLVHRGSDVYVIAAQVYSYVPEGGGDRVYVTSGVPSSQSRDVFRAMVETMARRGELEGDELTRRNAFA